MISWQMYMCCELPLNGVQCFQNNLNNRSEGAVPMCPVLTLDDIRVYNWMFTILGQHFNKFKHASMVCITCWFVVVSSHMSRYVWSFTQLCMLKLSVVTWYISTWHNNLEDHNLYAEVVCPHTISVKYRSTGELWGEHSLLQVCYHSFSHFVVVCSLV